MPLEPKKEKRNLRYHFSATETHELSLQLANNNQKLVKIKADKKSISKKFDGEISQVETDIDNLSTQVSNGYEVREVDCEVYFHQPEKGKKTIVRLDTKEKSVEKMDPWDYNLFTQEPDEKPSADDKPKKDKKTKNKKGVKVEAEDAELVDFEEGFEEDATFLLPESNPPADEVEPVITE